MDIAFRGKKKNFVSNDEDEKDEFSSCSAEKPRKPYKKGTTRKTPLYMNCMLAAPDGSRLCTLDPKKADWYIERGIGMMFSHFLVFKFRFGFYSKPCVWKGSWHCTLYDVTELVYDFFRCLWFYWISLSQ